MTKLALAAAAALLIGSTSMSLAEDSSNFESALAVLANQQQYSNTQNSVRNARAQQITTRETRAVQPVTAEENAYFARITPQTAN